MNYASSCRNNVVRQFKTYILCRSITTNRGQEKGKDSAIQDLSAKSNISKEVNEIQIIYKYTSVIPKFSFIKVQEMKTGKTVIKNVLFLGIPIYRKFTYLS
jgi:hypothetical protein